MLACSLPDVNARETMTITPIPRTLVRRSILRNVTRHNVQIGGDILIDVSSTRVMGKSFFFQKVYTLNSLLTVKSLTTLTTLFCKQSVYRIKLLFVFKLHFAFSSHAFS